MPIFPPRDETFLGRIKNLLGLAPDALNSGERGERSAEEFLRRECGFVIVARNWRNPRDRREEIDLVARDGEVLVFIEVKTRAARALVSGYHAVNARKKTILRRAVGAYLAALADKPRTFRFDLVEVTIPANAPVHRASVPVHGVSTHSARTTDAATKPVCEVRHFANVPFFPKHFQP